MPRVPRTALPDGYFHVFTRGVDGIPVFPGTEERTRFVELLWRCARRHRWACYAATVLTTHYHLVLEARQERLSLGMQALNWNYARYFNKRHVRFGHVFAARFGSRVIEREEYLFDACTYVLQNPVKAGLCERVEEWPWSYSRYGLDVS